MWHEFDAERTASEVRDMAAAGATTVRTHCPWDVFMPDARAVPARMLRAFETLLTIASDANVQVQPVLFAQAFGHAVMLPAYAIDVSAPRAGVRVLTDAVAQPGGPREQYTDSRMVETAHVWLETMLDAFAGHPAVTAWDLGHDPATVMRPRRIADATSWVRRMSEQIRDRGERCMLTLGRDDIISARAMRPHLLAEWLDCAGLAGATRPAAQMRAAPARAAAVCAQLLMRMIGAATPLCVEVDVRDGDVDESQTRTAESSARDCISALVEAGAAGLCAAAWADCGPRVMEVAPLDREPGLGQRGLVRPSGEDTGCGVAWRARTAHEIERRAAAPWPDALDVDDYYAALPESAIDLVAARTADASDIPAMLD